MKRVSPGDPLSIPSSTWNQLVASLEQGTGAGPGRGKSFRQSVTAFIRNNTGAALPRFGVVGLSTPVIQPSDGEENFLSSIAFSGVLAAGGNYDLKWGLTLSPIPANEFGEVVIQGLSFCKLDTADVESAGPNNAGDVDALTEASCGLARVLWRESGSGDKWAIVCLG